MCDIVNKNCVPWTIESYLILRTPFVLANVNHEFNLPKILKLIDVLKSAKQKSVIVQ